MCSLRLAVNSLMSSGCHSACNSGTRAEICSCRMVMACLTKGFSRLTSGALSHSRNKLTSASCSSPLAPVISAVAASAKSYFMNDSTRLRVSRSRACFSQHDSQGGAISFNRNDVVNLVSPGETVSAELLASNLRGDLAPGASLVDEALVISLNAGCYFLSRLVVIGCHEIISL